MPKTSIDIPTTKEHAPSPETQQKLGAATVGEMLQDPRQLAYDFMKDPYGALDPVRNSLYAMGGETRMPADKRREWLGQYLDAYTRLTIQLDRTVHTNGDDGNVHVGVPKYLPDGFIDMGGKPAIEPSRRGGRDQIKVDKTGIYARHRELLLDIFGQDYSAVSEAQKQKAIASKLLMATYVDIDYDYESLRQDGRSKDSGVIGLHTLQKGVCRHKALMYQVLAQACGLDARLLKCNVDGVRHAANTTRIGDQWYLTDPTICDSVERADGRQEWRPGVAKLNGEPHARDMLKITQRHSRQQYRYDVHDDMYWRFPR